MQTTLRINDEIYRRAKASAAKQGITLTCFIEEALQLRLNYRLPSEENRTIELPTFGSPKGFPYSPEDLKKLNQEAEEDKNQTTLGKIFR